MRQFVISRDSEGQKADGDPSLAPHLTHSISAPPNTLPSLPKSAGFRSAGAGRSAAARGALPAMVKERAKAKGEGQPDPLLPSASGFRGVILSAVRFAAAEIVELVPELELALFDEAVRMLAGDSMALGAAETGKAAGSKGDGGSGGRDGTEKRMRRKKKRYGEGEVGNVKTDGGGSEERQKKSQKSEKGSGAGIVEKDSASPTATAAQAKAAPTMVFMEGEKKKTHPERVSKTSLQKSTLSAAQTAAIARREAEQDRRREEQQKAAKERKSRALLEEFEARQRSKKYREMVGFRLSSKENGILILR